MEAAGAPAAGDCPRTPPVSLAFQPSSSGATAEGQQQQEQQQHEPAPAMDAPPVSNADDSAEAHSAAHALLGLQLDAIARGMRRQPEQLQQSPSSRSKRQRPTSAPEALLGMGAPPGSGPALGEAVRRVEKRRCSDTEAQAPQANHRRLSAQARLPAQPHHSGVSTLPLGSTVALQPLHLRPGDMAPILSLDVHPIPQSNSADQQQQQPQLHQVVLLYHGQGHQQMVQPLLMPTATLQQLPAMMYPQHLFAQQASQQSQQAGTAQQLYPSAAFASLPPHPMLATLQPMHGRFKAEGAADAANAALGSSADSSSPGEVEGPKPAGLQQPFQAHTGWNRPDDANHDPSEDMRPPPVGRRPLQSPRAPRASPSQRPTAAPRREKDVSKIPKYMAVADRIMEVAHAVGATGFLEAAIRDPGVLGNNPDTSVTLRWLVSQGKLVRTGMGGRPDPFRYFDPAAMNAPGGNPPPADEQNSGQPGSSGEHSNEPFHP